MHISDGLRQKMVAYSPPGHVLDILSHTNILLLVGISGAGKDTLLHQLLSHYPDVYQHVLSYTTRAPRVNKGVMERDGIDYHFVSPAAAEQLIDDRAFIEVKEYGNNIYGTGLVDFTAAQQAGKIALTDVEVKGADEYVQLVPSIRPVFILPPSYEVWQQRMQQRYGGNLDGGVDNLTARIAAAKVELEHALEVDYFVPIINDDLETTVARLHAVAQHQLIPDISAAQGVIRDILARL